MNTILIIVLFLLGYLFFNASHIPAWIFGEEKPTHKNWEIYGIIAVSIWVLTLIFANI